MPELPKACARCGTPYGLTRQPFSFAVRGQGALPWRRRSVDLLFCHACWKRRETAVRFRRLAVAVFLVAVPGGAILSVLTSSAPPAVVGGVVGLATLLAAAWLERSSLPRHTAGPKTLTIDVPNVGRVDVDHDE
jgi:hypothetical protein